MVEQEALYLWSHWGYHSLNNLHNIRRNNQSKRTSETTGALSYTGTSAINLGGNITTSGGTIGLTGPVP